MMAEKRQSTLDALISRLLATVFVICATVALPSRAEAQFSVCNQTFDVVNIAVGQFEEDAFKSRGWWTIGPNQCANVIQQELTARYVYVFAQDVFGKVILGGSAPMCVAPERFEIVGDTDCLIRGFIEARFHEVDTQRTERWTFFLNPPPQ